MGANIADEVTIRVREFANPGTRTREVELTGIVATRAAGETVDVLVKECGPSHRHYRVVAGAKTVGGGSWRIVTNEAPLYLQLPINSYFRARWRGHLSTPVLNAVPAYVSVTWRPRLRRAEVAVSSGQTGQNLRGRFVDLQRKLAGTDSWVRVRRARLGRGRFERYLGQLFRTRFSVRARGLTLRVLVPEDTGTPCFSAGVSQTWRS
jgi:hypothetical protein